MALAAASLRARTAASLAARFSSNRALYSRRHSLPKRQAPNGTRCQGEQHTHTEPARSRTCGDRPLSRPWPRQRLPGRCRHRLARQRSLRGNTLETGCPTLVNIPTHIGRRTTPLEETSIAAIALHLRGECLYVPGAGELGRSTRQKRKESERQQCGAWVHLLERGTHAQAVDVPIGAVVVGEIWGVNTQYTGSTTNTQAAASKQRTRVRWNCGTAQHHGARCGECWRHGLGLHCEGRAATCACRCRR